LTLASSALALLNTTVRMPLSSSLLTKGPAYLARLENGVPRASEALATFADAPADWTATKATHPFTTETFRNDGPADPATPARLPEAAGRRAAAPAVDVSTRARRAMTLGMGAVALAMRAVALAMCAMTLAMRAMALATCAMTLATCAMTLAMRAMALTTCAMTLAMGAMTRARGAMAQATCAMPRAMDAGRGNGNGGRT
jgi:hypothetical protein